MSISHDSLFRALIDDVGRAGVLIRDYLPEIISSRLADEPPVLLDGTFIDPALKASQSDRLFSVALRDGGWALLYILFEHKSAPDPFIVLQLLGYRREIWRRYAGTSAGKALKLPLIIPLVFYHGRQEWKVPLSITECIDADQELREFMSGMGYILCDLGHIPDNELASDAEVCAGLLPLKHVYRGTDPEVLLQTILPRLTDGTHLEEQVIRYMIRLFPAITIELLTRVARRVKPHREGELISLAAKEWLRQGEEAGFARGEELGFLKGQELGVSKGVAKAKIDSILVTLETRFGAVPGDMEAQVRRSAPELLDDLFKRALTAATLELVFTSGNRH
jgi:predicted transposase YdaD